MRSEAPASPYIHRIGQLVRARGLEGELQARLFRARPDQAFNKAYRSSDPHPIELEWKDGHRREAGLHAVRFVDPTRALLRLDGIRDRGAAEALEGAFVDVDPSDPPETLCDELDRLFDAELVDAHTGDSLGRVDDLRDTGAHPLLVAGELMVPFVEAFIEVIEPGRVRVRLPDGLKEIYQS
ncbi:MAG: hypothetical protein AAGD10_02665 [Myxococcota bacterium]